MNQCVLNGALITVFVLPHKKGRGCDIMKDLIKKKVLAKHWTFNEIANLKSTIASICNELVTELTVMEKLKIASEVRINERYVGMEFSQALYDIVYISLEAEVANTIKELLNTATVNFGGNNNEISENGLVRESNKKRPADEKKKDDNKE